VLSEGSPKGPGQTGGLSFGTFLWPNKEKYIKINMNDVNEPFTETLHSNIN